MRATVADEVLCTVLDHAGSTYGKPGLRVRMAADSSMDGMVNGGCFDADLLEQAAQVRTSGLARVLVYDARDPADEIFGSGSGCRGAITVLVEPAPVAGTVFSRWLSSLCNERPGPGLAITAITGPITHGSIVNVGRAWLRTPGGDLLVAQSVSHEVQATLNALPARGGAVLIRDSGHGALFLEKAALPLRLLVLGGGRDAEPLVALAGTLGWRTVVVDHRPTRAEAWRFPAAEAVCLGRPPADALAEFAAPLPAPPHTHAPGIDNTAQSFDAAVIMTHNLVLDGGALAWLAAGDIPFVGLLGPAERRDRLLAALGTQSRRLEGRLFAPVGLHLGGRRPETIALSIIAQVQAHHAGAQGGPLAMQASHPASGDGRSEWSAQGVSQPERVPR